MAATFPANPPEDWAAVGGKDRPTPRAADNLSALRVSVFVVQRRVELPKVLQHSPHGGERYGRHDSRDRVGNAEGAQERGRNRPQKRKDCQCDNGTGDVSAGRAVLFLSRSPAAFTRGRHTRRKLLRGDYFLRSDSDRHTSKYNSSRSVSGMGRRGGRKCSGNASKRADFHTEPGNRAGDVHPIDTRRPRIIIPPVQLLHAYPLTPRGVDFVTLDSSAMLEEKPARLPAQGGLFLCLRLTLGRLFPCSSSVSLSLCK